MMMRDKFKGYKPKFYIEEFKGKKENFVWILDRKQKISVYCHEHGTLDTFLFEPNLEKSKDFKLPSMYHNPTYFGARMMTYWWLNDVWSAYGERSFPTFEGIGSSKLIISCPVKHPDGGSEIHKYCFYFDSSLNRYVIDTFVELRSKRNIHGEYCNFYVAGLGDSRKEKKKYKKTIFTDSKGNLSYFYQNPCTPLAKNMRDRNLRKIKTGGFIGFFTEEDINPVIEIIESSPESFSLTCDCWYDEHLSINSPGKENFSNGFYNANIHYRLISLPEKVCRKIEKSAKQFDIGKYSVMIPFVHNEVNNLETQINPYKEFTGCCWLITNNESTYSPISWCKIEGYSGKKSIRLYGCTPDTVIADVVRGPAIHGYSNKKYYVSVYVKTKNVEGQGAYIQLDEVYYHPANVQVSHTSRKLNGNNDWTLLSFEFKPVKYDPFFYLYFKLEGKGEAFFDDIIIKVI